MRSMLKSKKGMTLMEIIIGAMLFGMVVMTVSAVLAPLMMAARRANDFAEYNQILDSIGNRIVSEMAQSEITATGTNTVTMTRDDGATEIEFSVAGAGASGVLQRALDGNTAAPVFPGNFYRGKTISFEVNGTAPDFTVDVTVHADGVIGRAEIVRTYAVRPLLMTNSP